jgi:hypothetical protein
MRKKIRNKIPARSRRMKNLGRYIAIDPGEVWLGMAALEINLDGVLAESRVLHLPSRPHIGSVIDDLAIHFPATIICEDYRVQPVGHQRFSGGDTLKVIGALEAHALNSGCRFFTIQPGSADEVEDLFGGWMQEWREQFQVASQWRHAMSAWRVLGRHLMSTDLPFLTNLRMTHGDLMKPWLSTYRRQPHDLIAPALRTAV